MKKLDDSSMYLIVKTNCYDRNSFFFLFLAEIMKGNLLNIGLWLYETPTIFDVVKS